MFYPNQNAIKTLVEGTVFFDVTEFMLNPVRAGVPRTVLKILFHWPSANILPFCVMDNGKVNILWPQVVESMIEYFSDDSEIMDDYIQLSSTIKNVDDLNQNDRIDAARVRLRRYYSNPALTLESSIFMDLKPTIFVAELFFHPPRCQFYKRAIALNPQSVFFLIHDYMLFLVPGIDPDLDFAFCNHFMGYVHVTRLSKKVGFVSSATKSDYINRITRGLGCDGPVFNPGADGTGDRIPTELPKKKHFVVLGAIEARKGQMHALRIFKELRQKNPEIEVTFVGKLVRLTAEEEIEFRGSVSENGPLRWVTNINDVKMSNLIRSARATVFLSQIEGFGLPPLESLYLGVPTITVRGLPSLESVPEKGRIVLDDIESEFADAVCLFLNDVTAEKLRHEAGSLSLQTWKIFVEKIAAWVTEGMTVYGDSKQQVFALRSSLSACGIVRSLGKIEDQNALVYLFYEKLFDRTPTGKEWFYWRKIIELSRPSSEKLCLAMIGYHATQFKEDFYTDLMSVAVAGDDVQPVILSPALKHPESIRSLFANIALALKLPPSLAVHGICLMLRMSPVFDSFTEESIDKVLKRSKDCLYVKSAFEADVFDVEFYKNCIYDLCNIISALNLSPMQAIYSAFDILLHRQPSDYEISFCSNNIILGNVTAHDIVLYVATSCGLVDTCGCADWLVCMIHAVKNLKLANLPAELLLEKICKISIYPDEALFFSGIDYIKSDISFSKLMESKCDPVQRLYFLHGLLRTLLAEKELDVPPNFLTRAEVVLAATICTAFDDKYLFEQLCRIMGYIKPLNDIVELKNELIKSIYDVRSDEDYTKLHVAAAISMGLDKKNWDPCLLAQACFDASDLVSSVSNRKISTLKKVDFETIVKRLPNLKPFSTFPDLQQWLGLAELLSSNGMSNIEFIAEGYNMILKRRPDDSGSEFYTNALADGLTRKGFLAKLASSEEYVNSNSSLDLAVWLWMLWRQEMKIFPSSC